MEVFAHYRRYHPRAHTSPQPGELEWRRIRDRLSGGSTVEDLKQAIDGYHQDPFHLGENDRRKTFLGLDLIMRDASHVQAGIEMLQRPKVAPVSQNGEAVREFMAMNGGKSR